MGILDNKSRVIDFILTDIGKSQLANGKLVVEHASLTDRHTFYEHDVASGSSDETNRIYFEAATKDGDTIAFETDDSGQLVTYFSGDLQLGEDGQIISGSSPVTGSLTNVDQFASMTNTLLSSSLDNFKNLQLISTKNVFNDEDFEISNREIVFNLSEGTSPVGGVTSLATPIVAVNRPHSFQVEGTAPVFYDWRLGGTENFKFLPPVNSSGPEDFTFEYNDEYPDSTHKDLDVSDQIIQAIGYPINLPFKIRMTTDPEILPGEDLSDRLVKLVMMNKSNSVPKDISTGETPIIKSVPDGRRVIGQYKPTVFLPDLSKKKKLRDTVHNHLTLGTPPIPSMPFGDFTEESGLALSYLAGDSSSKMLEGYNLIPGTPCNGDMKLSEIMSLPPGLDSSEIPKLVDLLKNSGVQKVRCVEKSLDNNLLIQFFETNPELGTMTKLDMIDAGETTGIIQDGDTPTDNRVFFVGKIFIDDNNVPHYVNLFTVVMVKTFQLEI